MVDVTRVLGEVNFSRKTHRNLSKAKSKKKSFTRYAKQYESEEGKKSIQSQLEKMKKYGTVIRVLSPTRIKNMKGLKRKKTHMMVIPINGRTIAQKVDLAYNFFEKHIPIELIGVTKGKGYECVVIHWDVKPMGGFPHYGVMKYDYLMI